MRISSSLSPYSVLSQRLAYAARHRSDVINLVENVPVWPIAPPVASASVTTMLAYSPAQGAAALLSAIAARENRQCVSGMSGPQAFRTPASVALDNVLVTNGATQAISLIAQSLPASRRIILCHAPVFIGIVRLMEAHGFEVVYLPHNRLLNDAISARMSNSVAAIYINSPQNPSGDMLSASEMSACLALAETWGTRVLIDAVYEDFCFDGMRAHIPRHVDNDLLFLVNSVSKIYGAPGLRIGWITASADNIAMLGGHLERECVAVSGTAQASAVALLTGSNAALVHHVDRSRGAIYRALDAIGGLSYAPTSAGTQILAHLEVPDIEAFADFALVKFGLILATTSNYGGLSSQSIRIPLGLERGRIQAGLETLARSVRAFKVGARHAANVS